MYYRLTRIALCFFILASCVPAQSNDETFPVPSGYQIREDYQDASQNWTPVPQMVQLAFAAAEDRKLFTKPAWRSTISIYVAKGYTSKSIYRSRRYTAMVSIAIGKALIPPEVLYWYVSESPMGLNCIGAADAALAYFGKSVDKLRLEEAAFLAALPKGPHNFHPVKKHERALERRNFVLANMSKAGFVSTEDAAKAMETELTVRDPLVPCEAKPIALTPE